MTKRDEKQSTRTSRRAFMRASSLLFAGGAVTGPLGVARSAHAFGSDVIRIGLVGCGRRGTQAVAQALNTATTGPVELVAMGDAFRDRLQGCYRHLNGRYRSQVNVSRERQFVGLDAYQNVLESDIDLVILATPPAFRPLHVEAAVESGKHVFMEMPVAVDADGVRRVLAAGQRADRKDLAITTGLQKRHDPIYRETVERLRDGAIGQFVFARTYWNGSLRKVWRRPSNCQELEYQLRNWSLFPWLSGDQIVEQHVQNLDIGNWLAGSCPVEAVGQGGRIADGKIEMGQVLDFHFVEFTYENEFRVFSQSRRARNCWNSAGEFIHGTDGSANLSNGRIYDRSGRLSWQRNGRHDGWQFEQFDLFNALRGGKRPNESAVGAASTMTAIMGRLATYTHQKITWHEALFESRPLAVADHLHGTRDAAPVQPDQNGRYPAPHV
jgi:myo-inositol 2-dehydrogenase/D-chiro-inositol 1-dehydrogenase